MTTGSARQAATAAEFSLSLVGTVIKSRYRVNAVSSVSPEAVVYGAEDLHHGRSIALKVLRDEFARDAQFVGAVRERARALAFSAHALRGVQRVYECGMTETGQLFIALESVEGATLRAVLDAGGALAVPTALRVAIRVGEALEALHHNRLVHGQLGPDAVLMVTDGERIKLSGTELAAAYRTPIGLRLRDAVSRPYRAPEQIERGEVTEATDVYALGMLLRQLLTAGKADPAAGAVAATPPLPASIQRIIAAALDPRPAHRPDISVMVNDIWGVTAVVAESPSRPRAAKARGNPRRRVRRRRGPFVLRMTAAVAAAGITAAVVWLTALDQIAAQLYSRLTPGAVTAVPVERSLLPPPGVLAPASAPREPTMVLPESRAADDSPTAEPRAPTAVHQTPSGSSAIDGRSRAIVEPGAPAAPSTPAARSASAPPSAPATPSTPAAPATPAASSAAPAPRASIAPRTSSESRTAIESRTSIAPRTPAESRPRGESRAAIESSAPIERRAAPEPPARAERRDPDATDGSAAVDWLLKDRR